MEIIIAILSLLSGLGLTLFGMKTMSDMLEVTSGNKLVKFFHKISNKRVTGVLIGAGVTGIIQSSGATTIMVIGFINAGIMTLFQATTIIMGANIGTTITAWIASFSSLKIAPFLLFVTFIGMVLAMFKKQKIKNIGIILVGLGVIFFGLEFMSSAVAGFRKSEAITKLIQNAKNPFLLIFIGIALTALLQSSSAVSAILLTMAIPLTGESVGLITITQAGFAILGSNIGSCITAILSAIGANTNSKRAALIHFMFNCFGVILFTPILYFGKFMEYLGNAINNPAFTIATFHTLFNVSTTLILLPFVSILVKIATKIIPEKKADDVEDPFSLKFKYIDPRFLNTPSVAMSQIREEIMYMADLANDNLKDAVDATINVSLDKQETFAKRETKINYLNRQLAKTLVKVSGTQLTPTDKKILGTYYHVISDIERIGDYAENLMEYAEKMKTSNIIFSCDAQDDIRSMYEHMEKLHAYVIEAFKKKSLQLKPLIDKEEDAVDICLQEYDAKHIKRLEENRCSPENGAIFLSLISNLERIADHTRNIAISLKDYVKVN